MFNENHLTPYLVAKNIIQSEILEEEYVVESMRSLYFHLSNCHPFVVDDGKIYLKDNISTKDYTPKLLKQVVERSLEAASNLYKIKAYTTKNTQSTLISVLQEAIQDHVVSVFYDDLEQNRTERLLEFCLKMKNSFKRLKEALHITIHENPIEYVFSLAKLKNQSMLKISVALVRYYHDIIKNSFQSPSTVMQSPDFFVKQEGTTIYTTNVPSIFPEKFAHDIAQTCLVLLLRTVPNKVTKRTEEVEITTDISTYNTTNLVTFELMLPEFLPEFETPEEEIANFRAAAWSLSKPIIKRKRIAKDVSYPSIEEIVRTILLKPLWDQAKAYQKDIVDYLINEQRLLDILKHISYLYLMKRGDLHIDYIDGTIEMAHATSRFKKALGVIPFFDYRFIHPHTILMVVPIRLRRVITQAQLEKYQNYYVFMLNLRISHHKIASMKRAKSLTSFRLQVLQFIISLEQIIFYQVDSGMYKLIESIKKASTFEEVVELHNNYVNVVDMAVFSSFGEQKKNFNIFFELVDEVSNIQGEPTESQVYEILFKFETVRSFLIGMLTPSAQANPGGIANAILSSIGAVVV